jgi:hypothetical protein
MLLGEDKMSFFKGDIGKKLRISMSKKESLTCEKVYHQTVLEN